MKHLLISYKETIHAIEALTSVIEGMKTGSKKSSLYDALSVLNLYAQSPSMRGGRKGGCNRYNDIDGVWRYNIIADIEELCMDHKIPYSAMKSRKRQKEIVRAKKLIIKSLYYDFEYSTKQIGWALDRDHTTILHHLGRVYKDGSSYGIE